MHGRSIPSVWSWHRLWLSDRVLQAQLLSSIWILASLGVSPGDPFLKLADWYKVSKVEWAKSILVNEVPTDFLIWFGIQSGFPPSESVFEAFCLCTSGHRVSFSPKAIHCCTPSALKDCHIRSQCLRIISDSGGTRCIPCEDWLNVMESFWQFWARLNAILGFSFPF